MPVVGKARLTNKIQYGATGLMPDQEAVRLNGNRASATGSGATERLAVGEGPPNYFYGRSQWRCGE